MAKNRLAFAVRTVDIHPSMPLETGKTRRAPPASLLLVAGLLGCGARTGLDIRSHPDASVGDAQVADVAPAEAGPTDAGGMRLACLRSDVQPLGADSAPVRMFLFQDFQGSFDHRFATDALPLIRSDYVDGDKVQLLHIDFPLQDLHPNAFDAAVAGRAANVFGKFWDMRDLLYQRRDEWVNIANASELRAKFAEYARSLGINEREFLREFNSGANRDAVRRDIEKAVGCEVVGVPTSIIVIPKDRISEEELARAIAGALPRGGAEIKDNGSSFAVVVLGAYGFDVFRTILDAVSYR